MLPPQSALQRIAAMDDDELRAYVGTLAEDIRRKHDKMNRLKGDLDRQSNLLQAAHRESVQRGQSRGYRRRR